MRKNNAESGAAIVIVLLLSALIAGAGALLVTITSTETLIAGAHRHTQEALYAAEAAFERALRDLDDQADWTPVLLPPPGNLQSSFVDDQRYPIAPDGRQLDLAQLTRARQLESDRRDGPAVFGDNSPQWRLFAHTALREILPLGTAAQPAYVVVWVADDATDGDGNPSLESNYRLLVFAEAYGSGGARRYVEGVVGRSPSGTLRVLTVRY
jgi:hypothetical protein